MRGLAVTFLTVAAAVSASAATPSDFYLLMLRRGVASYDGGRYQEATRPLHIAAFGMLDSVEHYQTAQIYIALVSERLRNEPAALEAASRVVAAERVEARYARLPLPEAVRTAFDALAKRVLTPAEAGWLNRTSTSAPPPPATTPSTQKPPSSAPTSSPPRTVQTKPPPAAATNKPPVEAPAPQKKPQPQAPTKPTTPATTTASPTPAPQTVAPKRPDVPSRLAAAEQALAGNRLAEARRIYLELLGGSLQRAETLRVAEGLYRARDFAGALRAFAALGALHAGEEPYHYYIAVARYETRDYSGAKRALDAALPYIELTPDVARYRDRIAAAAR